MNYLLFTEVTSYIRENYASISVQDLVDRFHFQEDYYNRLIKKPDRPFLFQICTAHTVGKSLRTAALV